MSECVARQPSVSSSCHIAGDKALHLVLDTVVCPSYACLILRKARLTAVLNVAPCSSQLSTCRPGCHCWLHCATRHWVLTWVFLVCVCVCVYCFIFYLFLFYLFFYVCASVCVLLMYLCMHACVCTWVSRKAVSGCWVLCITVTGCELFGMVNPGLLQEKSALLTAEPSPQASCCDFAFQGS